MGEGPYLISFIVFGAYLLGAVPFGLVLTRLAGFGDIRQIGSGNIGATNVLRTGRKDLAALTLILDSSKGAIAVGAAWMLTSGYFFPATDDITRQASILGAGLAAVLGHNFPIWLQFQGGKGVATTLGVLLATAWPVGLAACGTWLIMAALFRISSLSAIVALGLSPVFGWLWATPAHAGIFFVLAVLAALRHKENISRIMAGTEPKIGANKKDQ